MAVIEFNVAAFRELFPEFSNQTEYPTARLTINWTMGTAYVSDRDYGWVQGAKRVLALNLMAAHLTAIGDLQAAGETPGMETSATIDRISVSTTPPPLPNQWQWWLGLTSYGQQFLALMQANSAGGIYLGGSPELSAFRKVYGRF